MAAWSNPCSCICLAEGYLCKPSLPDVPVFACGAEGRDARRVPALQPDGDCHPVAALPLKLPKNRFSKRRKAEAFPSIRDSEIRGRFFPSQGDLAA